MLSGDNLADLGTGITLTFGSLPPVHIGAADFFIGTLSTGNNGSINGIKFGDPGVEHAAVDIAFSGSIGKGQALGELAIISPINLRVDVFADTDVGGGTNGLLGRAANSQSEGVFACTNHCGDPPPSPVTTPEPAGIGLLGSACSDWLLCGVGTVQSSSRSR